MGFFDFLRGADTDAGIQKFHETNGAVLLDVRDPDEFRGGHIPGALNLPLDTIGSKITSQFDSDTPLFVYCLSGARSTRAAVALRSIGFTNVNNIGGINRYHGKLER